MIKVSKKINEDYKDEIFTIYYTKRPELSIFGFFSSMWSSKVVAMECGADTILSVEETNYSNTFRLGVGVIISCVSFSIWLIVVIAFIKDICKKKKIAQVKLIEVNENAAYVVMGGGCLCTTTVIMKFRHFVTIKRSNIQIPAFWKQP